MKKVLLISILAFSFGLMNFTSVESFCNIHTPQCATMKEHAKKVLKAPPPSGVVINEIN